MNENNFYIASHSIWVARSRPHREPDFISGSGPNRSEYWYTPTGVIRCSNYWSKIYSYYSVDPEVAFSCNNIRFCFWVLDARMIGKIKSKDQSCGFCPWENFEVFRSGYRKYLNSSWYTKLKIKY